MNAGSLARGASPEEARRRTLACALQAAKQRFNPLGVALVAVLLLDLAFFAFLVTSRGGAPVGGAPALNADGAPREAALVPPGQS